MVMPYLQYNYQTKSIENGLGQPTQQRLRKIAQNVNIPLPNPRMSWIRGDLKRVYDLARQTRIVSMLDFESEDLPTESWAAFGLRPSNTSVFSGTRTLGVVNIQFRASATYNVYYD